MAKRKEPAENQEAAATPAAPPAAKPSTPSSKIGKLQPKNKSRLPRREKKAKQKAAGRL